MVDPAELHAVGDRIEALLDELRSSTEGRVWLRVEELVRLLTELYGAGLARTLELAAGHPEIVGHLGRDELVGSLLALHDLHPEPLEQRVVDAVASVTALLGRSGASVESVSVDSEARTVSLTVKAQAGGCGSTAETLREAVRQALRDAAPDADAEVLWATEATPAVTPVRLGRKPVSAGRAT